MGLTCSVLGHAFEAAELEREREEQGSEAVTVVREVETCRRCGERRVVSENKEVTAIVDPDDVGVDATAPDSDGDSEPAPVDSEPEPDPASESATESTPTPDHESSASGAEGNMSSDTDPDSAPGPASDVTQSGAPNEPPAADDFEPPTDPEKDDAEILEDSREEPRTPGQWPDDDDSFEPTSLTGGPENGRGGDNVVDDVDADADRPEVEPAATASSVARGDYVCPSCGFATPAERSSLRAGDACPECQRGYLESR